MKGRMMERRNVRSKRFVSDSRAQEIIYIKALDGLQVFLFCFYYQPLFPPLILVLSTTQLILSKIFPFR